jgi:phage/plasmid-like protein (TIGR03299 family)
MSHELTIRKNGHVEMAYVGSTPWHGLGQKLEENTSIEEWQRAAGMDWRIQRSKVRYAVDREATQFRTMDDKHVLFRSDTKADLGVVSDGYKVVQPGVMLEFFRDLTEASGFRLETAGTMFGGRRFWALASTGESALIADARDRVNGYLLLSTSCDGSMATEARYTNVRVVCHNTLSMARDVQAKVRVVHRSTFKPDQVKKELGIEQAHEAFASTMGTLRALANTELLPRDALMQTACLVEPRASEMARDELMKVLDNKAVKRISELALDVGPFGKGLIGGNFEGVKGSQWGWLNAVTQYVDHEARARSHDNRLSSAWFGPGDALKSRAYDMARASLISV